MTPSPDQPEVTPLTEYDMVQVRHALDVAQAEALELLAYRVGNLPGSSFG